MAITEETRHKIYEAFKASFGSEVANGVMELLPPVGWADVATKPDLAVLEARMDLRFRLVGERFETLEARFGERFETLEARFGERFETLEARFGERLERALRLQSVRFTASLFAGLTLFGVLDRLIA